MQSKEPVSIFDMIGPIMVGPSSSHTAGAVRLGLVARSVLGIPPQDALIELHGSFAQTGRGHGTDKAIVAGLLGFGTADDRIRDSFQLASAFGLHFVIREADLGEDVHPNSARITLSSGETSAQIVGASIGGGLVEITEIQGYPVDFSGNYDTLLVISDDQPGTINTISGWLVRRNINVAFFRVGRQKKGGEAIMIIETDQAIPDRLIEYISQLSWVRWVRRVPKVGD